MEEDTCIALGRQTPCVVASVDYALAPEHPSPAAREEAYAALLWAAGHAGEIGADAGRIAVAGQSAGGNLAAVISIMSRDLGGPAIAFQALFYPATDLAAGASPSRRDFSKGFFLDARDMEGVVSMYVPDEKDRLHPYVSPLRAQDLGRLPPALVVTAGCDPLRDEGEAYARRLSDSGVKAETLRLDDMIHAFLYLFKSAGSTRRAIETAADAPGREAFGAGAEPEMIVACLGGSARPGLSFHPRLLSSAVRPALLRCAIFRRFFAPVTIRGERHASCNSQRIAQIKPANALQESMRVFTRPGWKRIFRSPTACAAAAILYFLFALLSCLFLFCPAPAGAVTELGPPEPMARYGNWSVAVGGFYYEDKLITKSPTVFDNTKTVQNRLYFEYVEATYGFAPNWEVYAQAGDMDVRVKRAFEYEDFQDTKRPFGLMGIRGSAYQNGRFSLGPFIEATIYSDYDSRLSGIGVVNGTSANFTADVHYQSPWDATAGISAQFKEKRFSVYGGAFGYVYRVKIDGPVQSTAFTGNLRIYYQEETNVGGFVGVRLLLPEGFSAGVEAQYRERYSFGVSLHKSF